MRTNTDFLDFEAAAAGPVTCAADVLDAIEAWVKSSADHIDGITASFQAIKSEAAAGLGDGTGSYLFGRCCSPESMPGEVFEHAAQLVKSRFIQPQHVEVENITNFITTAFCFRNDERHERDTGVLRTWSAELVRSHFVRIFGDVREAAISQLRWHALKDLYRRPEEVTHMWTSLHESSFNDKTTLRQTYHSENIERFGRIVRYIIHLKTGQQPTDITIPPIFGYNDGAEDWARRDLYKKQKNPFPGCTSFRFCAGGGADLTFEPEVLVRLQAQWDAKDSAEAKQR